MVALHIFQAFIPILCIICIWAMCYNYGRVFNILGYTLISLILFSFLGENTIQIFKSIGFYASALVFIFLGTFALLFSTIQATEFFDSSSEKTLDQRFGNLMGLFLTLGGIGIALWIFLKSACVPAYFLTFVPSYFFHAGFHNLVLIFSSLGCTLAVCSFLFRRFKTLKAFTKYF